MESKFAEIGKQFLDHYYKLFQGDRNQLAPLYGDNSLLTFEGVQCMGRQNIIAKLTGLQFQACQITRISEDFQPDPVGGIEAMITGKIVVEANGNPIQFCHSFRLGKDAQGNWNVSNETFRLHYG